jgi:hypothetical protein
VLLCLRTVPLNRSVLYGVWAFPVVTLQRGYYGVGWGIKSLTMLCCQRFTSLDSHPLSIPSPLFLRRLISCNSGSSERFRFPQLVVADSRETQIFLPSSDTGRLEAMDSEINLFVTLLTQNKYNGYASGEYLSIVVRSQADLGSRLRLQSLPLYFTSGTYVSQMLVCVLPRD